MLPWSFKLGLLESKNIYFETQILQYGVKPLDRRPMSSGLSRENQITPSSDSASLWKVASVHTLVKATKNDQGWRNHRKLCSTEFSPSPDASSKPYFLPDLSRPPNPQTQESKWVSPEGNLQSGFRLVNCPNGPRVRFFGFH